MHRRLNLDDLPLLTEFIKGQRPLWNYLDFPDADSKLEEDLTGSSTELYGLFEEGILTFVIGVFKWEAMPYFTFIRMSSGPHRYQGRELTKKFNGLVPHVLEEMLKLGRHTFYYALPSRHFTKKDLYSTEGGSFLEKYIPMFSLYQFNIESFIPAGAVPQFRVYRTFLHRSHPVDVIIRRATLKPAYFSQIFGVRGPRRNLLDLIQEASQSQPSSQIETS